MVGYEQLRYLAHQPPGDLTWESIRRILKSLNDEQMVLGVDYVDRILEGWPDTIDRSHTCLPLEWVQNPPSWWVVINVLRLSPSANIGVSNLESFISSGRVSALRKLVFDDGDITPEELKVVVASTELKQLCELSLVSTCLTDEHIAVIAEHSRLKSLSRLNLSRNQIGDVCLSTMSSSPYITSHINDIDLSLTRVSDAGIASMAQAKWPLKSLVLSRNRVLSSNRGLSGDSARLLANSENIRQLKVLKMDSLRINGEAALELLFSKHLASLSVLHAGGNRWGPGEASALSQAKNLQTLHTLSLEGSFLGDKGVSALVGSPYLSSLEHLDLGLSKISDKGIAILAGAQWSRSLKVLRLKSNHLTADGVKAIALSPHLQGLVELDLSGNLDLMGNTMGDQSACAIAQSPYLHSLESLNLSFCGIGPEGVKAIVDSPHLRSLKRLCLNRNRAIGPEEIRLIASSPNLSSLMTLELTDTRMDLQSAKAIVDSPYLQSLVVFEGEYRKEAGWDDHLDEVDILPHRMTLMSLERT